MAEFFGYRILNGRTTFANVPLALRDEVAQILTEEGHGELAVM